MGKYFVMSKRFNKKSAMDFGFLSSGTDTAIDPSDGSTWVKTELYDFGWGKENGFYKSPLPNFDTLFELVLHSDDQDDIYGAASVIIDKYANELLCHCEMYMSDLSRKRDFKKLITIFNLRYPLNRCPVAQKPYEQVKKDFIRWKKVSETALLLEQSGKN